MSWEVDGVVIVLGNGDRPEGEFVVRLNENRQGSIEFLYEDEIKYQKLKEFGKEPPTYLAPPNFDERVHALSCVLFGWLNGTDLLVIHKTDSAPSPGTYRLRLTPRESDEDTWPPIYINGSTGSWVYPCQIKRVSVFAVAERLTRESREAFGTCQSRQIPLPIKSS